MKTRSAAPFAATLLAFALTACGEETFVTDVPVRIVATSPSGGSVDAALDAAVTVTFSERMDPATVAGGFSLESLGHPGSTGAPVAVAFTVTYADATEPVVTLRPSARLAYSTVYRVVARTTLRRARDGGQLPVESSWTFRTLHPPALTLVAASPGDAAGIARTRPIVLQFSEPPAGCTAGGFRGVTVSEAIDPALQPTFGATVSPLPGTWTCLPAPPAGDHGCGPSGERCIATFTPSAPYQYSSTVTVVLAGLDGAAFDPAAAYVSSTRANPFGGQLPVTVRFSFEVEHPAPLVVIQTAPSSGAANVAVHATVEVEFDRSIEAASLGSTNFVLERCTDATCATPAEAVAAAVDLASPSRARLRPSAELLFDAHYRAVLSPPLRATDATSRGGNLVAPVVVRFRTVPVPALRVVATDPAEGGTGASPTGPVQITFSAAILQATLVDAGGLPNVFLNAGLSSDRATRLPATVAYDPATRTVSLAWAGELVGDTDHTVTVRGGATGVLGTGGQTLPADHVFGFRTRVSQLILSTDPRTDEGIAPPLPEVDVSRAVRVVFAECMDARTIGPASFSVDFVDRFGRTVTVPGAISFEAAGCPANGAKVAILTPALADHDCREKHHALLYDARYTARLAGTIGTLDGLRLLPATTWSFHTIRIAPALARARATNLHVAGAPVDLLGAAPDDVPVTAWFEVEFDRDMDPATLSADLNADGVPDNLFVVPASGGAAPQGTVTWDALSRTATLRLTGGTPAPLAFDAAYVLEVRGGPGGIADPSGNFLDGDARLRFETSPANSVGFAPFVTTPPASKPMNHLIAASFSRPLDPSTVSSSSIRLRQGTASFNATLGYSADTRSVTVTPIPLPSGLTLTLEVTSGVLDTRGNPFPAAVTASFLFDSGSSDTNPSFTSISPANLATGIVGDRPIVVVFGGEIILPASVDRDSFRVSCSLSGAATGRYEHRSTGTTDSEITFRPDRPYRGGETCIVTLTNRIADLSKGPLAPPAPMTFTVETARPSVASVVPADLATGVRATGAVTVTFSDPTAGDRIAPGSVGSGSVIVRSAAGPVPGTYSTAGSLVTFTPARPLAGGTVYTVEVPATGATVVTDVAGNPVSAAFTSTFTTEALAPRVLAMTAGAQNVLTFGFVDDAGPDAVRAASAFMGTLGNPGAGSLQLYRLGAGGLPDLPQFACVGVSGATVVLEPNRVQPLVPGTSYRAVVTDGLQDAGGTRLDQTPGAPLGDPFAGDFPAQ